MQNRDFQLQIKSLSETGIIVGLGSTFADVDSYGERVARGAFTKSLDAHRAAGTLPAFLYQHDAHRPIGVWEDVREGTEGLEVRGRLLLDTTDGRDAFAFAKAGAISGLSIGYIERKAKQTGNVRELLEVDLKEVSLVTFPANTGARVQGVKGARSIEDALRGAGLSNRLAKKWSATIWRESQESEPDDAASAAMQRAIERLRSL